MEHEVVRQLSVEFLSNAGQVDVVSLCRTVRSRLHQKRLTTIYWTFCFASKKPRTLAQLSEKCREELRRSIKTLVWNVNATVTPGDPRLPESYRDLLEASNMCHGVTYVAALLMANRRADQVLGLQSASLGLCRVVSVDVMKGWWKGELFNPLIHFLNISKPDFTLLTERDPAEPGYKHVWLRLRVQTATKKVTDLYMDPTAKQLGLKDVVTWHSGNPQPGEHYQAEEVLDANASDFHSRVRGLMCSFDKMLSPETSFEGNLTASTYQYEL